MPIDHPSPAKTGLDLPWNSRTAAGCVCKNVIIQMIKTTHDLAAFPLASTLQAVSKVVMSYTFEKLAEQQCLVGACD